jgi:hypothetical protein
VPFTSVPDVLGRVVPRRIVMPLLLSLSFSCTCCWTPHWVQGRHPLTSHNHAAELHHMHRLLVAAVHRVLVRYTKHHAAR